MALPPIPEGFELGSEGTSTSTLPPIPEGFELGTAGTTPYRKVGGVEQMPNEKLSGRILPQLATGMAEGREDASYRS
jgi:hypothetical protein